jgi:hypothetical protein
MLVLLVGTQSIFRMLMLFVLGRLLMMIGIHRE